MVPSSIEDADGRVGKMGETPIGTPAQLEREEHLYTATSALAPKVWARC
jgi:hypothetical protein